MDSSQVGSISRQRDQKTKSQRSHYNYDQSDLHSHQKFKTERPDNVPSNIEQQLKNVDAMIGSSRYRQKKSEDSEFERDVSDVIKLESIKTILNPNVDENEGQDINVSPSRNLLNSNNNERLAITSHGSKFKSENKQGAAPSVTSTSSPEPRIESIGIDGS